ncbi:MAG: AI-2E family transporter [Firmicutes bacterium]|nr:AI-2E family transporter [Bacillota bacterium]
MLGRMLQSLTVRRIILGFTGLILVMLAIIFRQRLMAIFTPFLVALIISYVLNPVVIWLQDKKFNRTLAVFVIYFVFFGLLFIGIARLVPVVTAEVNRLASRIPEYTAQIQTYIVEFNEATDRLQLPQSVELALEENIHNLEAYLLGLLGRMPEFTTNIARAIFNIVLILILTFYFLKDFSLVRDSFYRLLPREHQAKTRKIIYEIDHSLGNYIRGQLIITTIIAISTYLGLLFLGVDFALILGLIAGITNIIPYFGPFFGAIPAVLVALLKSPILALKVAIVITLIQQVESHLVAPQVLGKSMGMHPLIVILALLAGGQFMGITGMIIAVPVLAVLRILLRNLVIPVFRGKS